MFKYLECVPSELTQEGSEYIVRLNLLPIRLNFDQRTVFFLSDFFSDSEKNKISLPSSDFGGEKAGKVQFSMQQSDGKRSARVSFKNTDASKLKVELPGVSTSDERKDSSSRNCSNLSGGDGSNVRQRMLPTSCKSSTGSPLKSRNSSATSTQKQSTSFIKLVGSKTIDEFYRDQKKNNSSKRDHLTNFGRLRVDECSSLDSYIGRDDSFFVIIFSEVLNFFSLKFTFSRCDFWFIFKFISFPFL